MFPPVGSHTNIKMVRPKQSSIALPVRSRLENRLHRCLDTRPDICVYFAVKRELVGSASKPGTPRALPIVAPMIVDEYLAATNTFAPTTP